MGYSRLVLGAKLNVAREDYEQIRDGSDALLANAQSARQRAGLQLADLAAPATPQAIGIIAAGLSLLLGPEGRALHRHDAAEVRKRGSVPLIVVSMAPHGDDVEAMISVDRACCTDAIGRC